MITPDTLRDKASIYADARGVSKDNMLWAIYYNAFIAGYMNNHDHPEVDKAITKKSVTLPLMPVPSGFPKP